MRHRPVLFALVVLVFVARIVHAQPRAACAACQPIVDQINALELKWEETDRQYINEFGQVLGLDGQTRSDHELIATIRAEFRSEVAAPRIKEIEERIASRQGPIREHSERAAHFANLAAEIRREIARLRVDLDLCNFSCHQVGGQPPQNPPPADPPPPPPAIDPLVEVPDCPVCKELATRLNNLLQQRNAARGTLDGVIKGRQAWQDEINERGAELKKLQASRQNNRASDEELRAEDRLEFAREQLAENEKYREFWEGEIKRLDAEIAPLQEQFNKCDKACRPPTQTGSLLTPKTLLIASGAVVGGLFVANSGGGASTPIATTAPSTPVPVAVPAPVVPPSTTPPVTTTPPATAAPTADGIYFCADCGVVSDEGGHNQFVGLCPALNGPATVRQGSITISHAAPFVPITGDYNTTTGAFTATGRGTVAGFPNVGVRADGTVNPSTGRITMTYTMGTNGELPGGRSITYRITLQRQP